VNFKGTEKKKMLGRRPAKREIIKEVSEKAAMYAPRAGFQG